MRVKLGFLAMAAVAACFIDRKSSDFECEGTEECQGDLVCRDGYCVVDGADDSSDADVPPDGQVECPAECPQCDPNERTCLFLCTASDRCGDITCPVGWDCQILCQGGQACGDITCQDGACNVQCANNNSCGVIDCREACACDVLCVDGACIDSICPIVEGKNCTQDGSTDSSCSSSAADCNQCN